MKKIILLGATAIVALLLIIFGPTLLDLYRLISFIEESTEAYEANGGPWPQLADVCAGCHGVNGSSQHQGYPSLAGQPAPYLAAQLDNFASGERDNPNMGPLAMTLSEAEVEQLADYYARQPATENRWFEPDPGLREKGKQLVVTSGCAACHGEQMMGRDENPRLAGQGYDYLLAQLNAFAAGTRNDSTGTMQNIAASVSPHDREAIATYLASLVPEQQTSFKGQD